jgi:hypothetical protein
VPPVPGNGRGGVVQPGLDCFWLVDATAPQVAQCRQLPAVMCDTGHLPLPLPLPQEQRAQPSQWNDDQVKFSLFAFGTQATAHKGRGHFDQQCLALIYTYIGVP